MKTLHKVIMLGALACAAASCESPGTRTTQGPQMRPATITGARLAGANVMSAAADWSRFPLGTRFQIVGSADRFVIDDYGGALIGTNTIDLYKTSRAAMRQWGVRKVDIDVIEWGSKEQSLKVLRPRGKNRLIRRMIAGLEQQKI